MTPSDSHGERHEREPGAIDDDPTGIRELLASLPDPGPMPEDLVERIGARLAVEQAHREQASTPGLAARSDSVIDLAAERSHRRPGRTVALLGAAAAGLLVATVAIGEFAGIGPASGPAFDSAAQVPARSAAGADSGGAADEGSDVLGDEAREEAGPQSTDDGAALDGGSDADLDESDAGGDAVEDGDGAGLGALGGGLATDVVVLPELGLVSSGNYRERILERAAAEGDAGAAAEGPLTEAGARTCWEMVGAEEPWPTLHAAQAELGGDRVVVLLGTQESDGEAAVLPWTCTEGDEVAPLTSIRWGD